jgi:hypothetical protein
VALRIESPVSVSLTRFPAAIVALAKQCRTKLRKAFPVAFELVYDYRHSLILSYGMTDRGIEAIVALAIAPHEIRLYFDKSLPDPDGVLEGKGSRVRSAVISSSVDLDRGPIRALIDAAIANAGDALPHPGVMQTIVKSDPKKQQAKRNSRPK